MQNLTSHNKYYCNRIVKDNKLCKILLKQHQIDIIMLATDSDISESGRGNIGENKFKFHIDLETFMVAEVSRLSVAIQFKPGNQITNLIFFNINLVCFRY